MNASLPSIHQLVQRFRQFGLVVDLTHIIAELWWCMQFFPRLSSRSVTTSSGEVYRRWIFCRPWVLPPWKLLRLVKLTNRSLSASQEQVQTSAPLASYYVDRISQNLTKIIHWFFAKFDYCVRIIMITATTRRSRNTSPSSLHKILVSIQYYRKYWIYHCIKNFWEEMIASFPLIRHGSHRRRRI
jgi:hypothetical protein